MKKFSASRTAQYMALFRALETQRSHDKLVYDPYAIHFLDRGFQIATRLAALPLFHRMIQRIIQKKIPGAYSSGIARTRYIDELVQQAVNQGVQQVVILGAGFDTRALRLDFLRLLPVIEIDHPNTSAVKKEKLGSLPAHVQYLQLDFNNQGLEDLALNTSLPTVFIWEGVTNYLQEDAVAATFRFMEKFPAGSYVIFTYVDEKVLREPGAYYGGEKLLHDVAGLEEKWTFGWKPGTLRKYLHQFGLELLEDNSSVEYRRQYMPGRTEKGYEFYRVAFAVRK
ncbi:class I SAM-dependent methyltransferase [Chitinophaga sancti]|uniref:class I SAM-dependent methyltransferase n=1 Tax=Chitinophaga sancti TaxID=1004 RepID=UPI003F7AAE18